jgi:hypothetical protein
MRMLTVNEIGAVSGGEAPCITLRTQCVGPYPYSLSQTRAGLNAAALALGYAAIRYPGAAVPLGYVALTMAAVSEALSWFED